jgi:hypothetical protein
MENVNDNLLRIICLWVTLLDFLKNIKITQKKIQQMVVGKKAENTLQMYSDHHPEMATKWKLVLTLFSKAYFIYDLHLGLAFKFNRKHVNRTFWESVK